MSAIETKSKQSLTRQLLLTPCSTSNPPKSRIIKIWSIEVHFRYESRNTICATSMHYRLVTYLFTKRQFFENFAALWSTVRSAVEEAALIYWPLWNTGRSKKDLRINRSRSVCQFSNIDCLEMSIRSWILIFDHFKKYLNF